MRKFVFIGIGGAAGAILRHLIAEVPIRNYMQNIPLGTLIINITGCFVLAFILTASIEIFKFGPNLRLGIATGFVGAYTTFSTVCRQTADLFAGGYYYSAVDYIVVSAALGFSATYFGVILARKAATVRIKDEDITEENGAE
jgi:CrcB protein